MQAVRRAEVTALVIGANGYLGSHVTRQLVADGQDVRVMVRDGANTIGIDDLDVTRFVGDIWDNDTLREAMAGVDDVYYCVVDTRGWLRDPAPLFHTNVDGTRNVLEIAKDAGLHRFVFTSSYVTVGRKRGRIATEDDIIVDQGLTPYVRSRVQAEELVLSLRTRARPARCRDVRVDDVRRRRLGPHPARRDHRRRRVRQAAVRDGQDRARSRRRRRRRTRDDPGRRARPGRRALPDLGEDDQQRRGRAHRGRGGRCPGADEVDSAAGVVCDGNAGSVKAKLRGTDEQLSMGSLRLMRAEAPVDCDKARRELGWEPRPVEESIREAARFWVGLREARRKSKSPSEGSSG